MIILLDAETVFDKTHHIIMIKDLKRLKIQGTYLNIIKAHYSNSIINMNLKGKKLKAITLKSGIGQGCALSPY